MEFGCVSSRVPGPMVFVCVCTGQCGPGSALLDLSSCCELYPPLQTLPLFSSVWPLCPGCRSLHRGLKVFLLVPPWAQCVRLCLYRAGTPEMSWPLGFLSRFQRDHFSESELALQESRNSQRAVASGDV